MTSLAQDNRTISYQVQDNEYVVAIVQEAGMKESDAKALALKQAATLTHSNGYSYFVVEKEGQAKAVISGQGNWTGPPPPTNLYYDLIQNNNFTKEQTLGSTPPPAANTYPAYRITFKCYKEKPSSSAIDACTLIDCGK